MPKYSRVVLAPVAGVKLSVANSVQPDRRAIKPAGMEARRIRLQGERGISRQTIAQGMPACSGCTCMLVCATLYIIAHETAGAASTRHSLHPPFSKEGSFQQTSGAMGRENAESYLVVIVRLVRNCALGRTIQYSRDSSDGSDRPRRTGYPPSRV